MLCKAIREKKKEKKKSSLLMGSVLGPSEYTCLQDKQEYDFQHIFYLTSHYRIIELRDKRITLLRR